MHQADKKGRGKRDQKLAKVTELWQKPPPLFDLWTDADEAGLKERKKLDVDLKDTALGRYQAQEKQRVWAAVDNMADNEWAALLEHIVEIG